MREILEQIGEKVFVSEDSRIHDSLQDFQHTSQLKAEVQRQLESNPDLRGNTLISIPPREISPPADLELLIDEVALMDETRAQLAKVYEQAGVKVLMAMSPFDGRTYHKDGRDYAWLWMPLVNNPNLVMKVKDFSKPISKPGSYEKLQPHQIVEAPRYNRKKMTYKHPNIATETVIHTDDNRIITISKFLNNVSTLHRIYVVPEDMECCLDMLAQVASALEYLHGMQIAHGDVKPENILVRHPRVPGAVKAFLMDFEFSRPYMESDFYRTPAFSEINYWNYENPHVDDKSDIFALGLLAMEQFGGRLGELQEEMNKCKTVEEKRICINTFINGLPIKDCEIKEELLDLIREMVRHTRVWRPGAEQISYRIKKLLKKLNANSKKKPQRSSGKSRLSSAFQGWSPYAWFAFSGISLAISVGIEISDNTDNNKAEKTFCSEINSSSLTVNSVPSRFRTIDDITTICHQEYDQPLQDKRRVSQVITRLAETTGKQVPPELLMDAKAVQQAKK